MPPTLLDEALNNFVELVFAFNPYTTNVPDAARLVTEIPPILLLVAVQSSLLKL